MRRAIRFESLTNLHVWHHLQHLQTHTNVHDREIRKQKMTLPLAILTEVFLPIFRLPLIAKHSNKRKFYTWFHATRLPGNDFPPNSSWKGRCLATATQQRSLLWLEAPIGYHSVRLVLRVLPSASHSPTIGFCVESQCIWGK